MPNNFWLIFPIFGFVMGGVGMWQGFAYRSKMLDLLKTYAEQGRDPPPELMAACGFGQAKQLRKVQRMVFLSLGGMFLLMTMGFGGGAVFLFSQGGEIARAALPLGVVAFAMVAVAIPMLIMGLLLGRKPADGE